MAIRIPLPPVTQRSDAKAHPFPFQIGVQTQEFLQGALFYVIVVDLATAEYIRKSGGLVGGLKELQAMFMALPNRKDLWDEGWRCLDKYKEVFTQTSFHSGLISLNSHWDWYVRKLRDFVAFARNHVPSPQLTERKQRDFNRLGYSPIVSQLSVLETATGITFGIEKHDLENLKEMSLVRNLGLHNRWEVDQDYLDRTSSKSWDVGDLRIFQADELRGWHNSLQNVWRKTARSIAIKYVKAPDYP